MDYFGKFMDKICEYITRMASWINTSPQVRLVFAQTGLRPPILTPRRPLAEFIYCLQGKLRLSVGTRRPVILSAGQVALINAHFGNNGQAITGECRYSCISFEINGEKRLDDLGKAPLLLVRSLDRRDRMTEHYRNAALAYPAPGSLLRTITLKQEVLGILGSLLAGTTAEDNKIFTHEGGPVRAALQFMAEAQDDPRLSLTMVAAEARLSISRFGRIFKEETGTSPMQYLRQMRVARARYLLERSDLSVKQICYMTGFNDQLYFSRAFRQETGKCPTVYRASGQVSG